MVIVLVVLLILFSVLLIKSADVTILALKHISERTRARKFVISAILLAVGTSFPEIFVGLSSAIADAPQIAFGVVLGSNIANITLVAGLTGVLAQRVYVRGDFITRDLGIALLVGAAPLIFLADGQISRPDGVVLFAIYIAYAFSFFKPHFLEVARGQEEDVFVYRIMRRINSLGKGMLKEIFRFILGIVLLLVTASAVVAIARTLALELGIPVFVISLIVLAIGTSLPEIAFSLRSLQNHEPSMFLGNLLGSTIANSTLVVGIAAMVQPIRMRVESEYFVAGLMFIFVSVLFWYFAHTKKRIDRWESLLLVVVYIIFVIVEFL